MSIPQNTKADSFAALHERGFFLIPNPWDVGSARLLEAMGFEALATTSSGFAQSLGRQDGKVTLEEKLRHCEQLARATSIPVSADLENGFGDDAETVASCILRMAETGVVGGSIEDFTGDPTRPIYDVELAVDRVAAAVEAARSLPFPFTVTARAEQQLRAEDNLDETIKRLQAYAAAGADVLYAPALKTLDEVREVHSAVDRPLNVLGTMLAEHSAEAIGNAGATRISVGGSLARLMAQSLIDTGTALRDRGDLTWAANAAPGSRVDALFAKSGDSQGD